MSSERELDRKPGGKRERTRAALVAAALEIVGEKGFAAASLDEIAARAGMTKGAIYSNFASKAELLLAAMSARGLTLSAARPSAASVSDELGAMADALAAMLGRARGEAALLREFQLYALSDPELRAGVAAVYSEAFTGTAAYLAKLPGAQVMPARHLAMALQSIALGFLAQSLMTPDEITPDLVRETFAALARGLA
jgi:AcrR family transcriptional regulator